MVVDPFAPPAQGPSSTLKALCYILIITCGIATLLNLKEALAPPDPEAMAEEFDRSLERFGEGMDERTGELMGTLRDASLHMAERASPIAWLKVLAGALAVAGAALMLKLRRAGFHLYLVGGLLWAFAPMLITGGNLLTWVMAAFYGFVVLVFTIVLATRLKELQ
jgi:hypothetical protein